MRLYNAHSCTPMGTAKLNPTPSFSPQAYLPTPPNMQRTFRVHQPNRRTIIDRYQPVPGRKKERNDDEGLLEAEALLANNESSLSASFSKADSIVKEANHQPIEQEEASPSRPDRTHVGACFLSFPRRKPAEEKARKRNSAFHSPLRIAKYSFQNPSPRSHQSFSSSDSGLDLVFSSSENSPVLAKNETNTTAATSEIENTPMDSSTGSFHLEMGIVKADSDIPARMLQSPNASSSSKSSSSTLTSNFVLGRIMDAADAPVPFDEEEAGHDENRTLFSPIPWQAKSAISVPAAMNKAAVAEPTDCQQQGSVQNRKSLFEHAWSQNKFDLSDGATEEESWIDFTADPFVHHVPGSLERPLAAKVDTLESTAPACVTETSSVENGFAVKPVNSPRKMDNFSSRLSVSGISQASFPSIDAGGGNTWSQVDSVDDRDDESVFFENLRRPPFRQSGKPAENRRRQQFLPEANRLSRNSTRLNRMGPLDAKFRSATDFLRCQNTKGEGSQCTNSNKNNDTLAQQEFYGETVSDTREDSVVSGISKAVVPEANGETSVSRGCQPKPPPREEEILSVSQQHPNYKDRFRRFCVYWDSHNEVGPNTLWSKLGQDELWLERTLKVDENEFARLFSEKPCLSSFFQAKEGLCASVRVIDPDRALRAEVVLSQIQITYEFLAQSIDRLDTTVLSADELKSILPFVPSLEESSDIQKSLRSANSQDWFRCKCEKFMAAMLHIPDAEEKLHHMIFMQTFWSSIEEMTKDAILIQRACQEVMSSRNFRRVLLFILSLGNRINILGGQNISRPVSTITLDSLVALNQTKAFDRQTTFLQYVTSVVRRCAPEILDWKQEDMPNLRRAHKIKWKLWQAELDLMEAKLSSLRAFCPDSERCTSTEVAGMALTSPLWAFMYRAEVALQDLRLEGRKANHALSTLWQYFGEASPSPSRYDSILGRLVLFGYHWERALETVSRRERQSRRQNRADTDDPTLSPCSSKESRLSAMLSVSSPYGHEL